MQCPPKAILVRLVREGTIADDAGFSADELERHLTECEDCQSFLLKLEAVSDSPKTLGRPPNTPLLDVEHISAGRKFGRYLLEELVGTGGHSHVYKARHETTGRLVAIKILLHKDFPPERLKSWKRESRLAGRLSHPHVVQILDADQIDGYECSVFEWMPGGTLSDQIRRSLLPPELSAEYARDLAFGCASLHERRILHRDIKPSNILLDADGKVKLADFGVARSLDETVSIEASEIIGTLGYMSPEQLGTIPSVPTETTDVYGIGAVLYAMLVGKGPFAGSDQAEVLSNATRGEILAPSRFRKIPKDLETVCLKCLEQNPGDRYQSMKALATDLEHFLAGDPITAARPSLPRRVRKLVLRYPAVTAVLSISAIGLFAAFLAFTSFQRAQRFEKARATLGAILDCDVALLPRRIAEFQLLHPRDKKSAARHIRSNVASLGASDELRLAVAVQHLGASSVQDAVRDVSSVPIADVAAVATQLQDASSDRSATWSEILVDEYDDEMDAVRILPLAALLCNADELSMTDSARIEKLALALIASSQKSLNAWGQSLEPISGTVAPSLLEKLKADSLLETQQQHLLELLLSWNGLESKDVARVCSLATVNQVIVYLQRMERNRDALAKSAHRSWQLLYDATVNARPDLHEAKSKVPKTLNQWIDDGHGFALGDVVAIPAIPLGAWEDFKSDLSKSGFQAISARPSQVGENEFVATTLSRSTAPTVVTLDAPESELSELLREHSARGLSPIAVWGRYAVSLPAATVRDASNDELLLTIVWQEVSEFRCEIILDNDLRELGYGGELTLANERLADSFWLQNLDVVIDDRLTAQKAEHDHVSREVVQPVYRAERSIALRRRVEADNSPASGYRLQEFPKLSLSASRVDVWERNFRFRERPRKLLIGPSEPLEYLRQCHAAADAGFELEDTFVTSGESAELLIASRMSAGRTYREVEADAQEARLALACWLLGDESPLRLELSATLDPSVRTELIAAAELFGADQVLSLLDLQVAEEESRLHQGILLMLGRSAGALQNENASSRERRNATVQSACASSQAGVANAAKWTASQLGVTPDLRLKSDLEAPAGQPGHGTMFTTVAGQEMVRVRCKNTSVFVGAERLLPLSASASQAIVTPKHDFAISTHEVTYAEYQQFIVATGNNARYYAQLDYSPKQGGPLVLVSYYGALEYCRWLSEQEGITDDQIGIPLKEDLIPGAVVDRNLVELDGYRLPTPIEWQIAVRAGSVTDRFIGRCDRELVKYGNTASRSRARMTPVGRFMPSPLGLHDVYGNVHERCLLKRHGENTDFFWSPAVRYELVANMGGSFLSHEMYSSSNCSNDSVENGSVDHNIGFRLARTIHRE